MIYDSLDVLPFKTFYKIQQTGNLSLLNFPLEKEEEAKEVFDRLSDEFSAIDKGDNFDKEFMLQKEIAHLEAKQKLCALGIQILQFELVPDIKETIEKELHFKIRTKNTAYYYKDLERVESKIALLNVKIERLKDQLKQKDNTSDNSQTVDDILASICTILGVSFDFNTIPCTTFLAYKKQTHSKIKAQDEQLQKLKSK